MRPTSSVGWNLPRYFCSIILCNCGTASWSSCWAGRSQQAEEIGNLPASMLALTPANRHVCTKVSRSWLCQGTTSPPNIYKSQHGSMLWGHIAHLDPEDVSIPSHHFMVIWISSGSKWSPRPGDGLPTTTKMCVQRTQTGDLLCLLQNCCWGADRTL